MKRLTMLILAGMLIAGCSQQKKKQTEVLISGGSVSGVAAALQAARQGADVILVSPHEWLGGMLTAAGVSATDGNHKLPSGIWGEFRQKIYDHYGGPEAVETGWVSNTFFEPHVGDSIFKAMVKQEKNIKVYYNFRPIDVFQQNNKVQGVTFTDTKGNNLQIQAEITIDATELGDVMAMADVPYATGQDARRENREPQAPEKATNIIQDLTYVAILKDYGQGNDHTLQQPRNYTPGRFRCCCQEVCDKEKDLLSCDRMLEYGKLPNEKYMINWPNNGNDYYANIIEKPYKERQQILEKAKDETRAFIYFLQTEGGYTNLGLAEDEFPTDDNFPIIAYHREARRMKGLFQLTLMDLKNPYQAPNGALYKTSIAVGDYPIDHHHTKYPGEINEGEFPSIPSYSVPYACMVPPSKDGLLVAEKSISVTHLTNGTTRLQPVVLQLGQAAGSSAAMCVQNSIQPREISIRTLQEHLLEANCWILPFADTQPKAPYFKSIMRTGATGIMRGEGVPTAWANRTWFYPDSQVSSESFMQILKRAGTEQLPAINGAVTAGMAACYLQELNKTPNLMETDLSEERQLNILDDITMPKQTKNQIPKDQPLTRKELAWLIDQLLKPFDAPVSLVPSH